MYFENECLLKIDLGGKLKVALSHKFMSLHERKFGLVKLVHIENSVCNSNLAFVLPFYDKILSGKEEPLGRPWKKELSGLCSFCKRNVNYLSTP